MRPFACCVFNLERSGRWDSLFLGFPAVTPSPTPGFSRAQAAAQPPSLPPPREQAEGMNLRQSRPPYTPLNKPIFTPKLSSSPCCRALRGTCPNLTSGWHVGTPGTFPGPLDPADTKRGEAAILPHDLPSEGRKRPPWSPINHGILFCNTGQMKRCRDPRPCVLWRGESFSSYAGAKHLPVSPQPGEPAPLLFILPPGTFTLSQLQPGAGGCGSRARPTPPGAVPSPGIGDFCWMLLLCQRQPRALRQPLPQKAAEERCPGQHFWRRLAFRGKSSDLVWPKHNKGWDLQLPDPSATFLQPFCLCYKRGTKEMEFYPSLKSCGTRAPLSNVAWSGVGCRWQRPQGVPRDGDIPLPVTLSILLLLMVQGRAQDSKGLGKPRAPAAHTWLFLCSAVGGQVGWSWTLGSC